MSIISETVERTSDCEESDSSIELTDDDKNYIDKLITDHNRIPHNKHDERNKCVWPCHICDKIRLSANPESTNTFLDFIFMEHENDFTFTKEKRRKIIQSLVHEFFEAESKKEEDKKPGSTTNVPRRSFITHGCKRLAVKRSIIRGRTKIISGNIRTLFYKDIKINKASSTVKKVFRPSTAIQKLQSQENKIFKSKANIDEIQETKRIHAKKNHNCFKKVKNYQYDSPDVFRCGVKPIQKPESQGSELDKSKANSYESQEIKRIPAKKNHNCFKKVKNYQYDSPDVFRCGVKLIQKPESQGSELDKSKANIDEIQEIKQIPAKKNHPCSKNVKTYQYDSPDVFRKEVNPASVVRKKNSHESQPYTCIGNAVNILGTKPIHLKNRYMPTHTNNPENVKMSRNIEVEKEMNPVPFVRKVYPEDTQFNDANVLHNSSCLVKTTQKENCGGTFKEKLPPMKDPESPFYIPEEYIDIAVYQEGLATREWNPTQVLYEICGCCEWGTPKFLELSRIINGNRGFFNSVRVKGYNFMTKNPGPTKKIAQHLASSRFLKHIGFKFRFNTESRLPLPNIVPDC